MSPVDEPTKLQRLNAVRNAAKLAKERRERGPIAMDWDAAVERLKAMLDKLEAE